MARPSRAHPDQELQTLSAQITRSTRRKGEGVGQYALSAKAPQVFARVLKLDVDSFTQLVKVLGSLRQNGVAFVGMSSPATDSHAFAVLAHITVRLFFVCRPVAPAVAPSFPIVFL